MFDILLHLWYNYACDIVYIVNNFIGAILMNKAELVEHIAKHADVSKVKAGAAVEAFVDAVTRTLKKGDSVTLVGFGSFTVAKRAARVGRNPKTGKEIKIAATTVAKFRAGKGLKDTVAGKAVVAKKPAVKAVAKKKK